ncbi:MAG: N-acetylmuramic acid 6-phosphate etherase [Verrucomicrobiota bacterium]|nr:N-acetylmuramic acid 6-phosphate etherase [Verrucomicrobiota bacterium]MDP7050064.1 N-acetylmuramic acid 6-phosphate etherase [Verrucomicrobiota bacterium]
MAGLLGIECGATHTVALYEAGSRVIRAEFGPANLRLLNDSQLAKRIRQIARQFPTPSAVAIGMAGARTEADKQRLRRAAARAWPSAALHATHDLETALAADTRLTTAHRVLVLSGTGSCCYGQSPDGTTAKLGGWGHILGDKGSGYEIGLRALRACVFYLDRDGRWSALGQRLLRRLQLNSPETLIEWVAHSDKAEVAGLAEEVFAAWAKRDKIARDILDGAADSLTRDACACARKLAGKAKPVRFLLAGGVLLNQPRFAAKVAKAIRARRPGSQVVPLQNESCTGALCLAHRLARRQASKTDTGVRADLPAIPVPALAQLDQAPTEQRHPRSMQLNDMPLGQAVDLFLDEDRRLPTAIAREKTKIVRVIRWVRDAFRDGGRLFYSGSGTSGRLGVLDASECPPTFRTDPEQVQGIIAGGQPALHRSIEGAEDDPDAGAEAVRFRGVEKRDVFIGIAASGRTPFVWGGIWEANRRGAKTALLCFNPGLKLPRDNRPDLVIRPDLGPELLTGSTRLKSGTATKLILNIITTLAMAKSGKVIGNLMVDLDPSNTKLRDRAVRILRQLTHASDTEATDALEQSGWNIKKAAALLAKP